MASCNENQSTAGAVVPANCSFGVKQTCVAIQSLPQGLPTDISADNVLFAFDGTGGCTSSETQTLTEALHWIETNLIDVLGVCQVASAPDCSAFTIQNGQLTPVSVLQLLECLPFTTQGQTILYTGSSVVIGVPGENTTYSWLELNDTTTSTGVLDYAGFAGGVPVVADDESGLVLQPCLPVTSICPSDTAGDVLTTTDDGTGTLTVEWQAVPGTDTTWLGLNDTFTNTGDETSYAGTAGYLVQVNDAETGLELVECVDPDVLCEGTANQLIKTVDTDGAGTLEAQWVDCIEVSESLCPGELNQLIQTKPDPANPTELIPQWVDCIEPSAICPGEDSQILVSRDDGTGTLVPTWEDFECPLTWLELTDTDNDQGTNTYTGYAGGLPIVNAAEDGIELVNCLPLTSLCNGNPGDVIQMVTDPATGNLEPQWVACVEVGVLCPGDENQVIETVLQPDGTLLPEWVDRGEASWLSLTDTLSGNIPESYNDTAGLIPTVNLAETDLVLSCLEPASICPGNNNELLMTIDDPANPGTLIVDWVNCLPIGNLCSGDPDTVIQMVAQPDGSVIPEWTPLTTCDWLSLTDTYINNDNQPTTYTGTAGFIPQVRDDELGIELVSCLDPSAICPGDSGSILQTLPNAAGELEPQWVDCLEIQYLCPGEDGQVVQMTTQPDGTLLPEWRDAAECDWLSLSDTFINGDNAPTDYTGTAGYIPIVLPDESGIQLEPCLPASSICGGTQDQILQTLPDPADLTKLVPQWVDCLPIEQLCPGDNPNDTIELVQQPDGTLLPTWVPGSDGTWLGLTDTFTGTADETTYAGTKGLVSRVNAAETGVELGCLDVSVGLCPGLDGQVVQTIPDPATGELTPTWVDCIDPYVICASPDVGDVIETVQLPDGTLQSQWAPVLANTWLNLTDTSSTNTPESYADTAGLVPVVNAAETGLELSCLNPNPGLCPGTLGQVIQTIDDPANPGNLIAEWVDCIEASKICPSDDPDDVLTTIEDPANPGTNIVVWQASAAGSDDWLGLTDTSTGTGNDTTYAGTAGYFPTVAADESGLVLTECLPVAKLCEGELNQFIMTVDIGAGVLEPQWVDCLPVTSLCPADDDCARLVSRNGTVQWVYDGAANLCDFFGQNDPLNNTIAEADIGAYYAGWEGATVRIREEGDGLEFVTQVDGITPPTQGQILTHDTDDNGVLQTHYYTPIEFEVLQPEFDENADLDTSEEQILLPDFTTTPNNPTVRFPIPVLNANAGGNAGVTQGAGQVIIDPTGTDPVNAFVDPAAGNRGGYVITKSARYIVCLRASITVTIGEAQAPGTQIALSPAMAILEQNGVSDEYRISEVTINVGSDYVQVGQTYEHFGSGCVVKTLTRGDLIQIRARITPANNQAGASFTDDPVALDGMLVTWGSKGTPSFSVSEIPGYDPDEV